MPDKLSETLDRIAGQLALKLATTEAAKIVYKAARMIAAMEGVPEAKSLLERADELDRDGLASHVSQAEDLRAHAATLARVADLEATVERVRALPAAWTGPCKHPTDGGCQCEFVLERCADDLTAALGKEAGDADAQ